MFQELVINALLLQATRGNHKTTKVDQVYDSKKKILSWGQKSSSRSRWQKKFNIFKEMVQKKKKKKFTLASWLVHMW